MPAIKYKVELTPSERSGLIEVSRRGKRLRLLLGFVTPEPRCAGHCNQTEPPGWFRCLWCLPQFFPGTRGRSFAHGGGKLRGLGLRDIVGNTGLGVLMRLRFLARCSPCKDARGIVA